MHLGFKVTNDTIEMLYDLADLDLNDFDSLFNRLCRPCLWKDGKVVAYLDPHNFKKFEDGTYVSQQKKIDVKSCEYMIEFPRMFYNFKSIEGIYRDKHYSFELADTREEVKYNDPFNIYFREGGYHATLDAIYVGMYEGYIDPDTKALRSIPGKQITSDLSMKDFLEAAKLHKNTSIMNIDQYIYIINLIAIYYLISYGAIIIDIKSDDTPPSDEIETEEDVENIFKELNLLQFIRSFSITGTSENKGMFFDGSPTKAYKLLGLENFLSNYRELIIPSSYKSSTLQIITKIMHSAEKEAGILRKFIPIKIPKNNNELNPGCTARLVAVKKCSDK